MILLGRDFSCVILVAYLLYSRTGFPFKPKDNLFEYCYFRLCLCQSFQLSMVIKRTPVFILLFWDIFGFKAWKPNIQRIPEKFQPNIHRTRYISQLPPQIRTMPFSRIHNSIHLISRWWYITGWYYRRTRAVQGLWIDIRSRLYTHSPPWIDPTIREHDITRFHFPATILQECFDLW